MTETNRPTWHLRANTVFKKKQERVLLAAVIVGVLALAGSLALYQCSRQSGMGEQHTRNNLSLMARCDLRVVSQPLHLWIAGTPLQRELGLMWVQPDEMADNQGMLFIFEQDQDSGFWMKNTLIPLDIAFIRHDGTVVDIEQMEPLSLVAHTPRGTYRYAVEVKAGTLSKAGLRIGDIVTIPADLLNP
jgi:uncharacterized membrane protein (UPF0127 family)